MPNIRTAATGALIGAAVLAPIGAPVLAPIAAAATASSPPATSSHAKVWQTGSVVCGIEHPLPHRRASKLLCSATGIPKPKGQTDGDPYVTLAKHGRPRLVLISQFSYETMKTSMLSAGSCWSGLGVQCTIAATTVTCRNAAGHGFANGSGHYMSF